MHVNDFYDSQMEKQQRILEQIQQGQRIIFKRIVQALSKHHRPHFPHISKTSLTEVSRTTLLAAHSPGTAKDEMDRQAVGCRFEFNDPTMTFGPIELQCSENAELGTLCTSMFPSWWCQLLCPDHFTDLKSSWAVWQHHFLKVQSSLCTSQKQMWTIWRARLGLAIFMHAQACTIILSIDWLLKNCLGFSPLYLMNPHVKADQIQAMKSIQALQEEMVEISSSF